MFRNEPTKTQGWFGAGAKLQKLADGFGFAEGPTCDRQGHLYFTDQPSNRIYRWNPNQGLSVFSAASRRANGMCFDHSGNLIVCAEERNALERIGPTLETITLADKFEGRSFNGPNDVWVQADGSIYFTDPWYPRPWSDANRDRQPTEQVYFLSADRSSLRRATIDLIKPNGLIGSTDGSKLYVSDSGSQKTYVYDILAGGHLRNRKVHCNFGSDGMTTDQEGNLYLTGEGVRVIGPDGVLLEHLQIPEGWTGNVSFGSPDRKTLYIAADHGLYSIATRIRGAHQNK
jgi:gluconolactonase